MPSVLKASRGHRAGVAALEQQLTFQEAGVSDGRGPEIECRVDAAKHPETLLGQHLILLESVERGEQVVGARLVPSESSKPAVKGLKAPTRVASTAGLPSAASQAVTPAKRTSFWRSGVADGMPFAFGSIRSPRPSNEVSSQQTTEFCPVAARPSIASSRAPARLVPLESSGVDRKQVFPAEGPSRGVAAWGQSQRMTCEVDDDGIVGADPLGKPRLERPFEVGQGRQHPFGVLFLSWARGHLVRPSLARCPRSSPPFRQTKWPQARAARTAP